MRRKEIVSHKIFREQDPVGLFNMTFGKSNFREAQAQ